MAKLKLAVLISGRGSNLQALIDNCAEPGFPAEIVGVVSNRPEAMGLERARKAGIPAVAIDHTGYPDRESFDAEMTAAIEDTGADLVCMAGYLRLVTRGFVEHWRDRMINVHPSLLPAYKGLDTHKRAIEEGVRFAGCTIHYVRYDLDTGPIIIQAAVPVYPDDDADTLGDRVLEQEHRIYPLAVRWIAEGRVRIENERAVIDGVQGHPLAVANPVEA